MRILLLVGNHPRHLYYASAILETGMVEAVIIEKREEFFPVPPPDIDDIDRNNFIRHFEDRRKAEKYYFPQLFEQKSDGILIREVSFEELNTIESVNFVNENRPDLAMVFGTGLIKEPLLSTLPKYTINNHLGISPRYKGSATLFWPFYNLEPQFAGTTFHLVVPQIDAGPIISHSVPPLRYGDGIHDVGAKAVIESSQNALKVIEHFTKHKELPLHKQTQTGRLYLSSDFIPAHLRVIYQTFNSRMVDYYLDGKLSNKIPNLIIF